MFDSIPVLEGNIVKRSLQFFWIVDHSGSMTGQKNCNIKPSNKRGGTGSTKSIIHTS